ncbi:SDR family NAD(P)-dependent oxidoreductase [Pseudemcibacter aquimaris]|uniref:SDR family NAD(P)-dependent oxidoreductase n=1 Tax=Pseudemcibacter aquimaris TaxID=2857064 RepID=UPI002011AF76|nr:SDR family NAD(P)-dependent oxidoreductase [Pseudemcibacter aquimaris]MCC3859991.1 SDR family NAD(P)-dependent oxidoreductase [Pseudemcibacter aquimaris]WDU57322.1 SDR family NAD(P)-dependent oxidoreductase [Pseudemcibacter aquimaris]
MTLQGKVAIVTGASRGIGRATAVALAEQGAHIIAIARTVGSLEDLDDKIKAVSGENATLVPLDLTDYDAIDRLGGVIYEKWGKLDILVGNAGFLGDITPVSHLKPKTFDKLMNINVTANFRLIRSLDPLLRAADHGRAVFMGSSNVARNPRHFWGGYATSKAALECLVKTYAQEVEMSNLRVNILNPGPIRTAMRAKAAPGEDPNSLDTPEDLMPLMLQLCSEEFTDNGIVADYKMWKEDKNNFFF